MGKILTDLMILHEMVRDNSNGDKKTVAEYVKRFDASPSRIRRILLESYQYQFKKTRPTLKGKEVTK